MYTNIQKYEEMWLQGTIDRPLVVIIGGYAGTGKSTLARKLSEQFPFASILPTGILRAVLRNFISREQNPFLYVHTYDLSALNTEGEDMSLYDKYKVQAKPVAISVNKIVEFAATEKQQCIIEGNHILPEFLPLEFSVILVEIYLKVSDIEMHRLTIAGPTHNRK